MHLLAIMLGALVGLLGGATVPWLVARCPDPAPDPEEDPEDFPDHTPFAELAARPGLGLRCAVAGTAVGALLGVAVGWGWGLPWLLYLVPVGIALAVIDYVTWYLPSRIIWPSYVVVVLLEVVAALALGRPGVLVLAAIGGVGLGLYYGLMWFISPRMMAFGDVRLGALLGLALGPFGLFTVVISVGAAAVLAVLALVPLRRGGNMIRRKVPFGPFLLGGALVAVAVGPLLGG
ncbi:prepilin peptidase [Nocardioides sp. zg-536]|uniref:Prepilin peptidase n=1 Tax=Nocardioides faecalis TaxID=2803858 RepID=A0A939BUT0_9ACTN|nr:prepilin peptidase [Nocardioides faecalis]MBM9458817.1 prepilin peptidase [Nocardioides faecalis]MBS4754090.1 prepilin peptidase [Nocardioides faecalis]QVI60226.1 prepilin peptidase [Nocardioides faecalis]